MVSSTNHCRGVHERGLNYSMNWLHSSWLTTSNSECHLVLHLRKYADVVEDRLSVRAHSSSNWECLGARASRPPLEFLHLSPLRDAAFCAAAGAESAETPGMVPLLKGDKKTPSVWPARYADGSLIPRLISLLRQAFDEIQNGLAFVRIETTPEWHRVHGAFTFQRG